MNHAIFVILKQLFFSELQQAAGYNCLVAASFNTVYSIIFSNIVDNFTWNMWCISRSRSYEKKEIAWKNPSAAIQ